MWTALSSIVFGSRPTSEMDTFDDRSLEHSADLSTSKPTDSRPDVTYKDMTEHGFAIHARRVKTHNTLRQALDTLEDNVLSTAGSIKIIMAELGTILLGDVTGLPENTVYDIIPAKDQLPIDNFITQCVINQDSIAAWTRITEEAMKQMLDAIRELHQPVETTSIALHTALSKMLPFMELPNLATFDATTNSSDDKINKSLRKGIDCLKYLVKTHKTQLARYQAVDLKPFIYGAKKALLSVDDEYFEHSRDLGDDTTYSILMRRIFDVGDQVKFREALKKTLALMQEDHLQDFVDIHSNLEEFLRQLEGLQKTHQIESA